MLKRCIVLVAAVCALSVVCLSTSKGLRTSRGLTKEDASHLAPEGALRLMRVLGTAEAEAEGLQGSFVPLEQLLSHRSFQGHRSEFAVTDSTSARFKDYKLSVVVTGDGKHFHAALTPNECGYALSADDSYVIYEGHALGCPAQ
jgi:hypothetical protein